MKTLKIVLFISLLIGNSNLYPQDIKIGEYEVLTMTSDFSGIPFDSVILKNGALINFEDGIENFDLYVQNLVVEGTATINGSAKVFQNRKGKDGIFQEQSPQAKKGRDGGSGENGIDSPEKAVNLKLVFGIGKIEGKLLIISNGGKGGNGGSGGQGGKGGGPSCNRWDGHGGDGGNGGSGGKGGNGGYGGNLNLIYSSSVDPMIVEQVYYNDYAEFIGGKFSEKHPEKHPIFFDAYTVINSTYNPEMAKANRLVPIKMQPYTIGLDSMLIDKGIYLFAFGGAPGYAGIPGNGGDGGEGKDCPFPIRDKVNGKGGVHGIFQGHGIRPADMKCEITQLPSNNLYQLLPNSSFSDKNQINFLYKLNDYQGVIEICNNKEPKSLNSQDYMYFLLSLIHQKKKTEAEEVLSEAIGYFPNNSKFLCYKGIFHLMDQNEMEAEIFLLKSTEISPTNNPANLVLAGIYLSRFENEKVCDFLKNAGEFPEEENKVHHFNYQPRLESYYISNCND